AEEDISTSIELRTYNFDNEYFYLGFFYQQLEEYEKAMTYYKKGLNINGNHAEAAYQIIAIKDYLGQSSSILIKEYQEYLEKFQNISNQRKQLITNRITQLQEK
ncbi:MAG: tetratricopeptide repeat protein, partial [Flavobacterium sp.]|nr:tetratricopeptide repeat protein [Flavobacterium sp.]